MLWLTCLAALTKAPFTQFPSSSFEPFSLHREALSLLNFYFPLRVNFKRYKQQSDAQLPKQTL